MNRNTERAIVMFLIIFGAAVRIHFLFTTPNLFSVEAESYSKIQLMLQWDQSPLLYPDINFGPFHMVLLQLPWKLTGSLVWANRIVSCLMGIALLPLVWALTRRLFDKPAAVGALAFLTMASLGVKTSVVTLAEGPTAFFMVLGLYLLTVYTDHPRDKWPAFFGSAAAFSIMTALRFETWLFLPLIPLWLWIKKDFYRASAFGAILALFPLLHFHVCWTKTGDPLHFMHTSAAITAMNSAKVPILQRAWGFPLNLAYTCSPVPLILLPIGFLVAFLRKKGALVGLFLFVILGMFEYKAINATLAPELFRYLTIPCVLIAILWAPGLSSIAERFFKKRSIFPVILLLIVGITAGGWSYRAAMQEARLIQPSQGVFMMLKQLKGTLTTADRIFIGAEYHPVIVVESGLAWENFRLPDYPDATNASMESIERIFSEYKPNMMLVFKYDSLFTDVLKFDPPCAEKHQIYQSSFCRQGEIKDWCWYRLCEMQVQ